MSTNVSRLRLVDAPAAGTTGLYVYALPHYLRFPAQPCLGRTYFKVGRSGSDVIKRFTNQMSTTSIPEVPVLLRIYETESDDTSSIETAFHGELQQRGHRRQRVAPAGREWFLTTIDTLDDIAASFDLTVHVMCAVEDVQRELDNRDAIDARDATNTSSPRCPACFSIVHQPWTGRRRVWCSASCRTKGWKVRQKVEDGDDEAVG